MSDSSEKKLHVEVATKGTIHSRRQAENDYDMSPVRHLPVIFVNGVPGAGNQTVAQTISNITGYTIIRPGELVRAESAKDTPRGHLVADNLLCQENIPEQITIDLIKESMLMQQNANGYILVGFPRNPRMSNIFNKQVKRPEKIVALEVDTEIAANRLQSKLSELGRPEFEINAARQIVKEAAHKVKNIHKRFGRNVVTLDSSCNPTALASTLKEILSDMMEKNKRNEHSSTHMGTSESVPEYPHEQDRSNAQVCPVTNNPTPVKEAPTESVADILS